MKIVIPVKFNSLEESKVFIKIMNKVKKEGVLSPLDLGNLSSCVKNMDEIPDNVPIN